MEDNRGEAIRVQRVVVVDVAAGIDIPGVIRIAAISRTQTDILRFNLRPIFFMILFLNISFGQSHAISRSGFLHQ